MEDKNKMIKLLILIISTLIEYMELDADSQINITEDGELKHVIKISQILTKAREMSDEY